MLHHAISCPLNTKKNITISIHVDATLITKETMKQLSALGIAAEKAADGMRKLSRAMPKATRDVRKFQKFLYSIGVGSSLPAGFQRVHRGRGRYHVIWTKYDQCGQLRSTRRKVTS